MTTYCEPLSHDWDYKWDDTYRKCKKCQEEHYYHFCSARWEQTPNCSWSELYGGPMSHEEYSKRFARGAEIARARSYQWKTADQSRKPPHPTRGALGEWLFKTGVTNV